MQQIQRPFAPKYINWFAQAEESADRLLRLSRRRSFSRADQDALFNGYWEVKQDAKKMAAAARDCGVLLHLGAQGIAYARQHFAKEIAA